MPKGSNASWPEAEQADELARRFRSRLPHNVMNLAASSLQNTLNTHAEEPHAFINPMTF
jgi:hypothetical protein